MKKDLIIATLLTFCSISTLFMIVPTESSVGDYDPWLDFNDDGKIDIKDIAMVARAYGSLGEPINKTALLLELQDRIDNLNATILNLQRETVRAIKFCYPSEIRIPEESERIVKFIWFPQNVNDNALLSVSCFMEYYTNFTAADVRLNYWIEVWDDKGNGQTFSAPYTYLCENGTWKWTRLLMVSELDFLTPNSHKYTCYVWIGGDPYGFIRNITVAMTGFDGLTTRSGVPYPTQQD